MPKSEPKPVFLFSGFANLDEPHNIGRLQVAAKICNIKVKGTLEVNSGFMAGFVISS